MNRRPYPVGAADRAALRKEMLEKWMERARLSARASYSSLRCAQMNLHEASARGCSNPQNTCLCECHDSV